MFTGLIEATGKILSIHPTGGATRLRVAGPAALLQRLHTGDSIAVSGVCLTALDIDAKANSFGADLAAATLTRTSLAHLHAGSIINLELPTPAGTPLGGHIVQGHVDGVGHLQSLEPVASSGDATTTDWWLRVSIPAHCARYVVDKGSITIEGISLTVARLTVAQLTTQTDETVVTVNIIPHTYAATNLHTLAPGSPLNIEVDVLAKYAERLAAEKSVASALTLESLIANGY